MNTIRNKMAISITIWQIVDKKAPISLQGQQRSS